MKITPHRKLLLALATLTAAAYFVHSDPSPPPAREAPREPIQDPAAPDPLPLSLLARLQRVAPAGARNLFQFGAPPPEPLQHPHTPPSDSASNIANPVGAATVKDRLTNPGSNLTFYGYIAVHARPLRAFFSDGTEIYIKSEGELIAGRYRILHIDAAEAVLEDTSANRRHTLTLDAF